MMKSIVKALAFFGLLAAAPAYAVEIDVNFTDNDKYRDVRAANEHSQRFKDRVFRQLKAQFELSASELNQGHKIVVDVTDIDLAGDVDYFFGSTNRAVRILKSIYFPRISLKYRLEDAQGNVLKEGEDTLKDMAFLDKPRALKYERGGFHYEKRLIDEWMKSEFSQK